MTVHRGLAAVAAAMVVAGCGGGSSSSSRKSGGGFSAALARIGDGSPGRQQVEWGDVRAIRKLAGLEPSIRDFHLDPGNRWVQIAGIGAGGLTAGGPRVVELTG